MKLWLYRHRAGIKAAYSCIALTVILILQLLETQGALP